MSEATTGKLNKGNYFLRPYSVFKNVDGRKPSHVETVLKGVVFSFTRSKLSCNYGYKNFTERLHVSKSSVARKVGLIKEDKNFNVERKGGKCSSYTYKGDVSSAFIITPDFFCTTEFAIGDKKRYLKGSEIDLLSLIYSHTCDGGKFEASYEKIAGILNYTSKRTVLRAVKALFKMDLIARPVKGENKHCDNIFTVQLKTLRKYERADRRAKRRELSKYSTQQAVKSDYQSEIENANARAERARFYDFRRAKAQGIAAWNVEKANLNPQYREIARRLGRIEFELANAECNEPSKLPTLKAEKKHLTAIGAELLAKMGLKPKDLEPQWKCKACQDTGYLIESGVSCSCYRSRGEP